MKSRRGKHDGQFNQRRLGVISRLEKQLSAKTKPAMVLNEYERKVLGTAPLEKGDIERINRELTILKKKTSLV